MEIICKNVYTHERYLIDYFFFFCVRKDNSINSIIMNNNEQPIYLWLCKKVHMWTWDMIVLVLMEHFLKFKTFVKDINEIS